MTAYQQRQLAIEADRILAQAGYSKDGRTKEEKKECKEPHLISTPCGGQPARRWKN